VRGLYPYPMAENNPYANDAGGFDDLDGPQRTSAMAVVSLVMSLVCCIPGLGLLGAAFGVVALMGIGRSRGRVGGKGMAMAGIIVGVLMTVAWISFAATTVSAFKKAAEQFYSPLNQMMTEIEAGDYDAARAVFPGAPIASATDEQFEAFRASYQAELGSFDSIPTDLMEIFNMYLEVGQQMQGMQQPQGGQVVIAPVPAVFVGNGPTVMIVRINPNQASGGGDPIVDISVVLPDSSELSLVPQGLSAAPSAPPLPGGTVDDAAGDDVP